MIKSVCLEFLDYLYILDGVILICYGAFVMNSITASDETMSPEKRRRGEGKGSSFFAVGRDVWETLWNVPTTNRLNLVLTYFTLLAGTGSDHRLTKWSASACEQYLGIGKPRAKHAIDELIKSKLVKHTDKSTRLSPQYELPELPLDAEPIFLPVQALTGLKGENPMFRRVRETGDAMVLRMLVDLYGMVETDATFGIPISNLRNGGHANAEAISRKVAQVGVHAVWALEEGTYQNAGGDWTVRHASKSRKNGERDWSVFWERIGQLKQIGAIYYEPWLFEGAELDAEPLMPLDPAGLYQVSERDDGGRLTRLAHDTAYALVSEERPYVFENSGADYFVPLPLHHQPPALRGVARLRVEADTPGRRLAWKRRRTLVENWEKALSQLLSDAQQGHFDRPMQRGTKGGKR
ncbi:hypothetical protein [Sphingopyxis sp. H053]|uniref:hypothetical protein n=2 Tax=Sphingopyxis TaxID=165697 RepID=UPI0012E377F6|nr:hypothetical protein [Sphingopyxis sp. H053]